MSLILPFMMRHGEQQHITENYVSVPPALTITDEAGSIWTLGFRLSDGPHGEYAFNVLKDGRETDETASRIERCNGRIRIFTANGWKWMRTVPCLPILVHAFGARFDEDKLPLRDRLVNIVILSDGGSILGGFRFQSVLGGSISKLSKALVCAPGEWLRAVVTEPDVKVMACLDGGALREIPVDFGGFVNR